MNITRVLSTLMLIGTVIGSASGEETQPRGWTLRQCIDYAIDNNLSVKYYEVAKQQREVALNTAQMSLLPTVSGGAGQSFGFGRALTSANTYEQRNTSNTYFNLGMNASLFEGFYKKNNIALSRVNLEIAREEKKNIENELTLNIISAYLRVLMADELKQVNHSHLQLSKAQSTLVERQKEIGRRSEVDVVRARAVVAQDSVSYVTSVNDYELSVIDLCQLLEVSRDTFRVDSPDGEVEFRVIERPELVFDMAVRERPEIRTAELRVESAERQISMAKSGHYPSLRLSAGLSSNYYKTDGWQNAPFAEQMKNNFSQTVSFTLSIPIFSAFSTRNTIKTAELQKTQTEIQLSVEKKNLMKAIEQAYYNVVAAQSKYESSKTAAGASEVAYKMVRTKFESGKAQRIEMDEARHDWVQAESSLVVAKYELLLKIKIFDFYRGKGEESM